jgi:hypothetical protein
VDSGTGQHAHQGIDAKEINPSAHEMMIRGCVTPKNLAASA